MLLEKSKDVVTWEIFPEFHEILNKEYAANNNHGDFLGISPLPVYDKVVMNPPFTKQQDIEHIEHAFKFLKPGGTLVGITSEGTFFRENKKAQHFRQLLKQNMGESIKLEDGAFKKSGTMVRTRIVKLKKSLKFEVTRIIQ